MVTPRRFLSLCLLGLLCAASAPAADDVVTKFDVPPMPMKTPPPAVSQDLKGKSGLVTAVIVINEDGTVASATVAKATDPAFEEPTIAALERWKFKPAQVGGQAVKAKIMVPVRFGT